MDLFSFLLMHGLWISATGCVAGALLLGLCLGGLLRVIRKSLLYRLPLEDRQEMEFSETGKVVLCLHGPVLSGRFAQLEFDIVGPFGTPVVSRKALMRMRTTGLSATTMEWQVFDIRETGRHVLRIHGLGRQTGPDLQHQVVIKRATFTVTLGLVIGIVLAGILLVASIVLFFMSI